MIATESLGIFFRKLEAMVGAGIPVHAALEVLADDDHPRLRRALQDIRSRINSGTMLSVAVQATGVFPAIVVHLLRNGESSGQLLAAIRNLADYLERSAVLKRKVTAAFAYPVFLLALTFVIVGVLGAYVFPRQQALALSLGAEIPWITSALTTALGVVFNPYTLAAGIAVVAVVGFLRLRLRHLYDQHLRLPVDGWLLGVPLAGPILRKAASARILAGMASLLEVGAGVGPRLAEVGALGDNLELELRFQEFLDLVKEGGGLASSCQRTGMFPPLVEQMLRVGEEQGNLTGLLMRAARIYEEDVESSLLTFVTLLEPLTMMFLGVVVGTLVLASALPILSLINKI